MITVYLNNLRNSSLDFDCDAADIAVFDEYLDDYLEDLYIRVQHAGYRFQVINSSPGAVYSIDAASDTAEETAVLEELPNFWAWYDGS